MIAHERLDVYRCSIQFFTKSLVIADRFAKFNSDAANQLKRAALSIPLNIAEGVGKVRPADQARYFAIARGSAMECAALMDVVKIVGCADDETVGQNKELLERIVAMLSKMCR